MKTDVRIASRVMQLSIDGIPTREGPDRRLRRRVERRHRHSARRGRAEGPRDAPGRHALHAGLGLRKRQRPVRGPGGADGGASQGTQGAGSREGRRHGLRRAEIARSCGARRSTGASGWRSTPVLHADPRRQPAADTRRQGHAFLATIFSVWTSPSRTARSSRPKPHRARCRRRRSTWSTSCARALPGCATAT
jgi:hypothetical protein